MSQYFHITDGEIDEGPIELPSSWRNVSGLDLLDDTGLAARGWLPQEVVGFTPFDSATQDRTGPVNDIQTDKVVSTYTVTDKSLSDVKDARKAELAALRYEKEIGGITLNDVPIGTDREDQAMVTGALVAFNAGAITEIKWKSSGGFVTLDATAFSAVATAVAEHVQACFSNEADLVADLDACETVSAVRAIDLTEGWPS